MAIDGFAQPWWLVLLVPVAALVVGYLWAQKRRHRAALRFSNLALLERVATRLPGWQRHIPAGLLAVALLLLTVGLAGPTAETKVPRNRATVVLVIDVSLSMQSTDVSPSRLAAAQDAASTFVRGMPPTINLGLESFAGTPAILVPPSTDREAVVSQIQTLKLAESTATGEALAAALNAIDAFNAQIPGSEGGPPPARIVLMSDGKQTVGQDEFAVAARAGQRHIPISTISFGTPYGSIDLDGRQIPVPVDDPSLQQVAQMSGGQFYPAQSNAELHQVYDTLGEQIGYQTVHADVSKPWFMLGTLICLLAAGLAIGRSQRLPI
ncbi:MAG TPA: VWA domain-containing protein [Pseudonocardia sp.]|uniref:VWA domain-containing protein n=1 Tax=Pseudonocardia sp. TaxID=60912 RepID=UPI002C327A1F|nr:VWA domain-containing protein [Pseudonocardia sp.]HTF47227.1 VWA domain-containing protein [Pseudonocardia sp.]